MQYEFWNSEQHSNWLADFMPIGASVGHSWPQCLHSMRMRPIPTDGLAWSFGWSVCLLSVDHYHKPCKNGIADRDSIRDVDSCESQRDRVPSWEEGALLRGTCLAVHILKMAHSSQAAACGDVVCSPPILCPLVLFKSHNKFLCS